jgi:hypothetical protein
LKSIYLIQSIETGCYKIGTSKNPNKRIEKLQTGNSSKLKIIFTFKSDLATQIEKILHRKYSHLKRHGEWFELSLNEELTFIKDCEYFEKNLNILKENENFFS